MSNDAKDWFDLPRPAQGIRLYEIRSELREKNLFDTEEPPLETSATPAAGDGQQQHPSQSSPLGHMVLQRVSCILRAVPRLR